MPNNPTPTIIDALPLCQCKCPRYETAPACRAYLCGPLVNVLFEALLHYTGQVTYADALAVWYQQRDAVETAALVDRDHGKDMWEEEEPS